MIIRKLRKIFEERRRKKLVKQRIEDFKKRVYGTNNKKKMRKYISLVS